MDGTSNSTRSIIHSADIVIKYQRYAKNLNVKVIDLGKNQMILGYKYTWLRQHNPDINWKTREVHLCT